VVGLRAQDYEPKPLPAGPTAYTQRKFLEDKAKVWHEMLLAECKVGDALRDGWKEPVETLMAVYADWVSFWVLGGDQEKRVLDAVDRLREVGCDDPVVALAIADILVQQQRLDAARPWFNKAKEKLQGRSSSLLQFRLHDSLRIFYGRDGQEQERDAALDECDKLLVEMAAAPELGKGRERFHLDLVLRHLGGEVGADALELIERIEKRAGKPTYTSLVLRARRHNSLAWAARGTGAASTISDEAREVLQQNLAAGEAVLSEACKLCPNHPEAPALMVKMIGPWGGEPADLRRWFDTAVAAQFDYLEAYSSYLHYSQPRWGGSQRTLLDFGQECLATGRFDTEVPDHYRLAVYYVALDSRDPIAVWGRSAIQKNLAKLDEGCLAAANTPRLLAFAQTRQILDLALGGKVEEAAALCEQRNRRIEPKALEVYDISLDWLRKTLRPHFKDYQPEVIAPNTMFAGFETADFPGAAKARPLVPHEKASTAKAQRAQFAAWLNTVFADAHARVGKHDAAWDADAREFLAGIGVALLDGASPEVVAKAKKLQAAKCDDPLVRYAIIRVLEGKNPSRDITALGGLLEGLIDDYPAPFAWWALQHLSSLARGMGRHDIANNLVPELRALLVAAAADPMFTGPARRYFVTCVWGSGDYLFSGVDIVTDEMVEELGTNGADPWVHHVLGGVHYMNRARSRSGTAEHLRAAGEHFEAAYQLAPELPDAAAGMVVVAAMRGDAAVTPREWFDRAIEREFDFRPAYSALVEALRPEHGGSALAMYRFGVECLDTGRFDTHIPIWFLNSLQCIQEEVRSPRTIWASAGVAERLNKVFDGYIAKNDPARSIQSWEAARCMTAWAGGRYEDALKAWEAAGRKLDPTWLATIGVKDQDLIEIDLQFLARRGTK
jgi:hypothetical protein